jgi:hypothetical protein
MPGKEPGKRGLGMGNVTKKTYLRKNKIDGQFSAREIEMMESPAFQVLSLSAHRILDRLEIEHAHHGGNDNGALPCTYDDFESYGIHRHSIGPGIREVVALGFVEITDQGRAGNAEWRKPSKFRLTYRYKDRAPPTHEWRRIKTLEEATLVANTARGSKRFPVAVSAKSQCGKRTTKETIHSAETTTTGHSAETTTTSISRPPRPKPRLVHPSRPPSDELRLLEAMIANSGPRLANLSARLDRFRPPVAA